MELESSDRASQRSLSRDLGIALGLTNLLVRNLVRRGWIRVTHIKPAGVRYLLTPAGIAEKARMSRKALQNNVRCYAEARDRIAERFGQISNHLQARTMLEAGIDGPSARPDKRIVFYGAGEVAEIGYICLQRTDLRLVGVVDNEAKSFFGVPVYGRDQLGPESVADMPYERLVVMSFRDSDEIRGTLAALDVHAERTVWL